MEARQEVRLKEAEAADRLTETRSLNQPGTLSGGNVQMSISNRPPAAKSLEFTGLQFAMFQR